MHYLATSVPIVCVYYHNIKFFLCQRARARVEDDKIDEETNPDLNPDMLRIHSEMSKLIQEAEAAGEQGDIDRVQDLMLIRLEDLTREKQAVTVSSVVI